LKKFIVGGINGRTGSTVYALWLDATTPRAPGEISSQVSWSADDGTPDWSFPVQHTHQFEVFVTAPPEFTRIWCRRNYFDSALSYLVAVHTNTYHIDSHKELIEYRKKYQNTKFVVDHNKFCNLLDEYNGRDCDVSQWQQQTRSDMITLLYHVHAQNSQTFYNAVNLPTPEFATMWPQPMSVNKYGLVENLSELLDVYCKFDSAFDVDKLATVARIEQYLNK
jgi:hypothetical protein